MKIRSTPLLLIISALASPVAAQTRASDVFRGRVGIEERLDQTSLVAAALAPSRGAPTDVPLFVRLHVDWADLQRAAVLLDERLDAHRRRGIPVLLAIGVDGAALDGSPAVTAMVRTVSSRLRGSVAGYQLEKTPATPAPNARAYAFLLKLAAVQFRAVDPDVVIAQATAQPGDAAWLAAVYAEGVAPYVDLAPIAALEPVRRPTDAAVSVQSTIKTADPSASLVWIGAPLGDAPAQSGERLLTALLVRLGERDVIGCTFSGSPGAVASALSAAAQIKDLLAADLVVLDDQAVSLAITTGDRDVAEALPHRVFYNASNGGTSVAYWRGKAGATPLSVAIVDQSGTPPVLRDPVRRDVTPVREFVWNPATKISRMTVRTSSSPLIIDFNYSTPNQFVSRADVSAVAALSVEEIVARHQQAQATQSNAYKTLIASLRLELHFRPSPTQVFDVVSDNRFFFGPDTVEWEERTFSVNGAHWGPDHPGLPLLQAEKVLSLPLDLRLTSDYRYRLEGTDTLDARHCYVISFKPADSNFAGYRGRVWIDARNFLRLKTQTIQTHLEGAIVSNEETTLYAPVSSGRTRPIFLPSRLSTKQILLIAGRNVLLEKEQSFSDYRIDPPEFEAERSAARASRSVMFRDTDAGVRYLVHRGNERVVSNDIRNSAKAIAMGTTIDPTFAFPLPILGLNYLNFNVKGSSNQMALLFGGVFVLGNLQTPKIGGTPFSASVDFFAIAVPGTDLRFDSFGERVDDRVLTIPASGGANIGYQVNPFQKLSAGYALRYDAYFHAPETAADFVVPPNIVTHGASVGYEFSRHGYRIGASASAFRRSSWAPWGGAGDFLPEARTYRRHSITAAKDFLLGPFQSIHVGTAWYGGARLDRFSMYQFGLFDEVRMHGVPAAGIRFGELVMTRGSYSLNMFNAYRLDLFVDHARGRDPIDRDTWQPVTGIGTAVTLKTPWNTMFTADIGKSFIPNIYRGTGSVVLQFLLLKPL
jgi:hypothetical protein